MSRIKYKCKKCGWEASIREEWSDLKPKKCMGRRCNTNFRSEPDQLLIEKPIKLESQVSSKSSKQDNKQKKRKEEVNLDE